MVFDLRGDPDPAALLAALDEIVRRYEALRTSFPIEAGRPRQEASARLRESCHSKDLPAWKRRTRIRSDASRS